MGPDDFPEILSGTFRLGFESSERRGGALSIELRFERGHHALLSHLTSGLDPDPGLECLTLIGVYRDGAVHVL